MIYLYVDKDCILDNNQFISRSKTSKVCCEGVDYIRLENNIFENTVLDLNAGTLRNSTIQGNIFKNYNADLDERYDYIIFTYIVKGPLMISNNYFDISNLNGDRGI